jgi:hypothetical protein
VRVKVSCRARTTCRGTVKLTRGGRVVGTRAVRVPAGRSQTVRVLMQAQASIAAADRRPARVKASAPRGARASVLT